MEETDYVRLADRVYRLERENKRVKRIALAAGILTACLLLMGQARAPGTVAARKFVLVDGAGKKWGELNSSEFGGQLSILSADEKQKIVIDGRGLTIVDSKYPLSSISTQSRVSLDVGGLRFDDEEGHPTVWLLTYDRGFTDRFNTLAPAKGLERLAPASSLGLLTPTGGSAILSVQDSGPSIVLRDSSNFETVIGATELITPRKGESHHTSAASITLFGNDKDGHVIWQAP